MIQVTKMCESVKCVKQSFERSKIRICLLPPVVIKCVCLPIGFDVLLLSTSGGAYTKKGANAPFSFFLHPLILLHRLGRDSSGRFGAVAHLRVGGTRADGAPRLTTRQSGAQRHAKKHG